MLEEYDIVILGGGTSGLVAASRLSEDPTVQVLVVEAGANHIQDPRVKIPAFYQALKGTEADWNFTTEAQGTLNGRRIDLSQGRALGGSSAINAHVFVPPSKTVIDAWEKLRNPGWNWDSLKPYYAKAYSLQPLEPDVNDYLGIDWTSVGGTATSGPIQTSYTGQLGDPIPKAWIDTFKALGYHMNGDPFAGTPMGAFSCLASIDPATKERSYAATAYYLPVMARQNLHILTSSTVEKILFDSNEAVLRATGIQFRQREALLTVNARLEVILAAGAVQSPKILEVSGIGSSDILNSNGIEVCINNPYVGENLQDHIVCSIGLEAKEEISTLDDLVRQDSKAIEMAMGEYMATKTGPLTSVGVASYAYLPLTDFLVPDGQRKLQKLLDSYTRSPSTPYSSASIYYDIAISILKSKDEGSGSFLAVAAQSVLPTDSASKDSPTAPVPGKFITLGTMLSQPLSGGSVHITSSDTSKPPLIDPKYLTHPLEMEAFARHIRYLETIAVSEPFHSLLKENGRRRDPKSNLRDLETAKDYIRTSAISMWHPTSTCAMLPRDKGGVVDEDLIVYGTSNLRVVDASIIPLIRRANVQSTVYAVAQRAADLIKAKHNLING